MSGASAQSEIVDPPGPPAMKKTGADGLPGSVAGITATERAILRPCESARFSSTVSVPHFAAMTMPLVPVTVHSAIGLPSSENVRGPVELVVFPAHPEVNTSTAPAMATHSGRCSAKGHMPPCFHEPERDSRVDRPGCVVPVSDRAVTGLRAFLTRWGILHAAVAVNPPARDLAVLTDVVNVLPVFDRPHGPGALVAVGALQRQAGRQRKIGR